MVRPTLFDPTATEGKEATLSSTFGFSEQFHWSCCAADCKSWHNSKDIYPETCCLTKCRECPSKTKDFDKKEGTPSLVDCPTQLTLVTWIFQFYHDKYQWEMWKNTAGKSATPFPPYCQFFADPQPLSLSLKQGWKWSTYWRVAPLPLLYGIIFSEEVFGNGGYPLELITFVTIIAN